VLNRNHTKNTDYYEFKSKRINNPQTKQAEKFRTVVRVQQFKIFSASLLTFAPWYF